MTEISAATVAHVVQALVEAAMQMAVAREQDAHAYSKVPLGAGSGYWARKVLEAMVEAGFTPDGWQQEFMLNGDL